MFHARFPTVMEKPATLCIKRSTKFADTGWLVNVTKEMIVNMIIMSQSEKLSLKQNLTVLQLPLQHLLHFLQLVDLMSTLNPKVETTLGVK